MWKSKSFPPPHFVFWLWAPRKKPTPCHVQPLASRKLHHPAPRLVVARADGVILATGATGYAAVGLTLGSSAL